MDITTLRIATTLLCFAAFLGILAWVYARGNRLRFEQASLIPFQQD